MLDIMLAAAVCIAIIGVGEVISTLTKAFVPSMAAALLIYLLLTWAGMPKDYPETSGFVYIGEIALVFLVVNTGTSLQPWVYIQNIKSVIIAIASVIGGLVCVVGIGGLFFGFDTMLAGAGAACGGGAVSGVLAIQKLSELGLVSLIAIPAILVGTVDLFGQPITSFILKKYAKKLSKTDAYLLGSVSNKKEEIRLTKHGVAYGSEDNPSKHIPAWIPIKFEDDAFVLCLLSVGGLIAFWLDSVTGISTFIWAFFIGIFGCGLGIFRMNLLDRSHSFGIVLCIFIVWLFSSMNEITPSLLLEALGPAVVILVLAAIGLGGAAGIAGKLLGYDFLLSVASGVGLMFLMPGVMIVCREVVKKSSRNEQEATFLHNEMAPSLFIVANAGFIIGLGFTVSLLLPMLA